MKRKIILLLFASIGISAGAQNTVETGYGNKAVAECQRLYSDGDYSAALTLIGKVDAAALDAGDRQEFELVKALVTFENDYSKGCELMEEYIAKYPNSSKKEMLYSYIAQGRYLDGDHAGACEWFGKSNMKRLDTDKRDRAELRYALALLGNGQEHEAISALQHLKIDSKSCSADAAFYLAVISYDKGDYDAAYTAFKGIQMDRKYYLDVPYYLAGIELKRGNLDEAGSIARWFIEDHGDKPQGKRMRQITGAVEFLEGNYDKAVKELGIYMSGTDSPQRISCYQMGVSLFEEGMDSVAKEMLDRCTDVDDELAQNAMLHIGIIQRRLGDDAGALVSFERAAEMPFNENVREEAMYNYAMCLHETNYSAFGKNIKAFETFLNEYPGSRYAAHVDEQLIDVYFNTKDYETALASISKINNPSAELLAAKQRIFYNIGIQEFTLGNLLSSVDFMDRSLKLGKYDKEVQADALYWKGEALYRVGEYDAARSALKQAAALGCDNSGRASYSVGYIYLHDGEYAKARTEFMNFLNGAANEDVTLVADAYSRVGDTYFYQKNYSGAEGYYTKAIAYCTTSADYPLFRSAITMGLNGNRSGKVQALTRLVGEYPESNLLEQAYYELGRTYIDQKQYANAIATYDSLIELSPISPVARRAATEKAMIYNNMGDVENAIKAYKHIIESYPESDEANIAAQDLKDVYIEKGQVKEFADYASRTAGMQKIESSEIDTLSYMSAYRIYERKDLAEAKVKFQEYLGHFPAGAFAVNSHYYIGVISFGEKDYSTAISHLEEVVKYPNSRYCEEAAVYAAEAYYNTRDFEKAIAQYRNVLQMTSNEERRHQVLMNIMHAAKQMDDSDNVIWAAGELVKEDNLKAQWRREALYNRAKELIASDKAADAMPDLKELSKETRSKEGAEGKFLYAEQLFRQGKYKECDDEISDYMEKNTPHTYWLARCFVLLSDLYSAQGKKSEAKQYLISLKNSYKEADDIAEMVEKRIAELSE